MRRLVAVISCQLSTINHQPSTINHQPSTNNHSQITDKANILAHWRQTFDVLYFSLKFFKKTSENYSPDIFYQ